MEATKPVGAKKVTISLPEKLLERVDRASKEEYGTRSAFAAEALRRLLDERDRRGVIASPEELRAIEGGRAEIKRGESVTLDDALHELEG